MRRNRILLAVALLALLLLELSVNNVFSLLLLLTGLFLPAVSILFGVLARGGLTAELIVPAGLSRGDTAEIKTVFHNSSVFPVALATGELNIHNLLTGTDLTEKIRCPVSGRGSDEVQVFAESVETGQLYIVLDHLATRDLFGLVRFPAETRLKRVVLVEPIRIPTEVNVSDVRETEGDSERYSMLEPGRDVSETFDVRPYAPGDEVRAIHWKLSAKSDDFMVRRFVKPVNYSVVLLVELAEADPYALESCVNYAANFSRGLLDCGVMHTFAWFDGGADDYCSFNVSSYEDLDAAVFRLVCSAPHGEEDSSAARFLTSGDSIGQDTTLLFLSTDAMAPLTEELAVLCRTHIAVVGKKGLDEADPALPIDRLPADIRTVGTMNLNI
ncbi:MAG: DUF58 domain-containing protein [Clostridia bacterium]|nr:DUF58 domain-containing protein [Clostridia bacterium]